MYVVTGAALFSFLHVLIPKQARAVFLPASLPRCPTPISYPLQQEVENFKKVNMISREQFDTLTPEPPVDPNQEVPPGPPRFQQGER